MVPRYADSGAERSVETSRSLRWSCAVTGGMVVELVVGDVVLVVLGVRRQRWKYVQRGRRKVLVWRMCGVGFAVRLRFCEGGGASVAAFGRSASVVVVVVVVVVEV